MAPRQRRRRNDDRVEHDRDRDVVRLGCHGDEHHRHGVLTGVAAVEARGTVGLVRVRLVRVGLVRVGLVKVVLVPVRGRVGACRRDVAVRRGAVAVFGVVVVRVGVDVLEQR